MIGAPRACGIAAVVAWWLLHAATPVVGQAPREQAGTEARPYREGVGQPLDFRGPDRDEPEPEVTDVVLGWFGPGDPDHPVFGTSWRGATLALEQENAAGGYRRASGAPPDTPSRPFRLEPIWSERPWKAGIADLLRFTYERHAWAIIGGMDGATTHLALQVALKSHFVLLTPASTDASTERANVPWLFSLAPSDEAIAALVVPAVLAEAGRGPIAIAASADHDGHAALEAVEDVLRPLHVTPAALVEYPPSDEDLAPSVARLLAPGPRAVLVLGPARSSGSLVKALRAGGFTGAVVGSATATSDAFLASAGRAADGVIAAAPFVAGPEWGRFAEAYRARWGGAPDAYAANAYDAVRILAAAIRDAGLNRARIRDAVRRLAPWTGAGATVAWDGYGRNQRAVLLSSWKDGRFAVPGVAR